LILFGVFIGVLARLEKGSTSHVGANETTAYFLIIPNAK
jgi:hypothetical protein